METLVVAIKWTGDRIRDLRQRLGLTQQEMAERLGYARYHSVSNLERGETEPTGPVQKLLDILEEEAERK